MSTTVPALGGEPRELRRRRSLTAEQWIVLALTVLAVALRLYQLSRPGYLTGVNEYDDAVDFGSALRLVHGFLPYREFVLVQPPGITLLMTPVALLANLTGTAKGFAIARVLTALAGAASVPLAGRLVRGRGPLVAAVTCGLLAVFPAALEAAHTVLLEPWLVLFCLIGMLALFEGDHLAVTRRRLFWAGAAFGFAGAIKVWAVLPVAVVLVLTWRALRWRSWLTYLGGVAAGFAVPVAPFALLAPRRFYDSVVVAQLSRVDVTRVRISNRLVSLTGLNNFAHVTPGAAVAVAAVIAAAVAGLTLAAWALTRRPPPMLERFALGTAVLVLAAFLWPADFYHHYAAFFIPFLALALALPAGRVLAATGPRAAMLIAAATAAALLALIPMTVIQFRHESKLRAGTPGPSADRQIPPGSCVLTDLSAMTIVANRFNATNECSPMIDAIGTDYALSHGRNGVSGAGRTPEVERVWLDAFQRAQYVWISCAPAASRGCNPWTNRRIPWTPAILGYFRSHFRPVPGQRPPAHVFVRRA
jgi:glycosyl transferase family 87